MSRLVTRAAQEREKLVQEKCHSILATLLADAENKYCADCDAKGPRWVSWNIGVFLCIRCAGIHRNLGVHISRVKSVNLDTWKPQQVAFLQLMGNNRARAAYEAELPVEFRRPQTDSALEAFIRAKYEHRRYMASHWQPPALPKVDWDTEIEAMRRRKDPRRHTTPAVQLAMATPTVQATPTAQATPITSSSAVGGEKEHKSIPPCSASSPCADLLGLSLSDTTATSVAQSPQQDQSSSDLFGDFMAAPTAPSNSSAQSAVNDLSGLSLSAHVGSNGSFNSGGGSSNSNSATVCGGGGGSSMMSRDSIMALYGNNSGAGGLGVVGARAVPRLVGGSPSGASTAQYQLSSRLPQSASFSSPHPPASSAPSALTDSHTNGSLFAACSGQFSQGLSGYSAAAVTAAAGAAGAARPQQLLLHSSQQQQPVNSWSVPQQYTTAGETRHFSSNTPSPLCPPGGSLLPAAAPSAAASHFSSLAGPPCFSGAFSQPACSPLQHTMYQQQQPQQQQVLQQQMPGQMPKTNNTIVSPAPPFGNFFGPTS